MNQILVYADSLTWGIIPNTRNRLPFEERWPGVVENKLNASGHNLRLIEDCLNGRRTVWDDPFKPGRKGLDGLAQRIEIIRRCRSSFSCLERMIFNSRTLIMTPGQPLKGWRCLSTRFVRHPSSLE